MVVPTPATPAPPEDERASPPGIAILAFTNLSGKSSQNYLADGIANDLITELSRNRNLFVVSRSTSFAFRGPRPDIRHIAQEIGVRYLLEGGVRRMGTRMRVTAQLVDAQSGRHIWTDRFDRNLSDIFAVQDEIVAAIVEAIGPRINHAERQRASRQRPETHGAWEAYQCALVQWSRDAHLHNGARPFLARAIALDPNFAAPHAMLSLSYLSETALGIGLGLTESVRAAEAEARVAVELDPTCASAHAVLSWVHGFRDDAPGALSAAETAISHSINDQMGHLARGRVLAFSGEPQRAKEALDRALRLDPLGPTANPARMHHVIATYLSGDYRCAETLAGQMIQANPRFVRSYPWLAAALGQLGRNDEARAVLEVGVSLAPHYIAHMLSSTRPPYFHRPKDFGLFRSGLQKAGLVEQI